MGRLFYHIMFCMDFVQSREETPFCIGGWDGICCGYLFNVYRGGEGRGGGGVMNLKIIFFGNEVGGSFSIRG